MRTTNTVAVRVTAGLGAWSPKFVYSLINTRLLYAIVGKEWRFRRKHYSFLFSNTSLRDLMFPKFHISLNNIKHKIDLHITTDGMRQLLQCDEIQVTLRPAARSLSTDVVQTSVFISCIAFTHIRCLRFRLQ